MTRPGTGAGSDTRELFQLGVEGGEFVRHLGVAHGFDPLLGKLLGKPDASIAPFEACIFLGRQHHEFIAAVRGGDPHRLAAGAVCQGSKALLQLGFGHADHFHANSVIHSKSTPNPVPKQLGGAAERARNMRQSPVYVLNHSQHNFRQRTTQADLDEIEDWTDRAASRMYEGAGLGPKDVDIFNPYDGYAPMAQFFLEAFQWHGVKRGDAFAFYAGDIRVEGPHPFCSSGGNLGTGRCRTAMYTDSIEQLRSTAGARQVKVRAETALAAFTTPSSGGWIMFGKSPS